MGAASRREGWPDLLADGLRHLGEVRRYAWFTALSVAGTVAVGLIPDGSELGLLALPVALIALYGLIPLARQMLTGALVTAPSDAGALLRLTGLGALLLLAAAPVLLLGLTGGRIGFAVAACLAVVVVLVLAGRMSFYLPALALDRPTGLGLAFAEGRGRRRDLAILALITFGPSYLTTALLPQLGLPGPAADALDGLASAAAAIVNTGGVCDLYRRTIGAEAGSGTG